MIEFEIDDVQFRFDKPSAMDQMHLSRKIGPLIPPLAPLIKEVVKALDSKAEANPDNMSEILTLAALAQPFADALAAMKNEDAEFVFDKCLGVLKVRRGDHWIAFWNSQAKMSTVAEMNDAALMMRLVLRVLKDSLGNFIAGFLSSAKEPQKTAA